MGMTDDFLRSANEVIGTAPSLRDAASILSEAVGIARRADTPAHRQQPVGPMQALVRFAGPALEHPEVAAFVALGAGDVDHLLKLRAMTEDAQANPWVFAGGLQAVGRGQKEVVSEAECRANDQLGMVGVSPRKEWNDDPGGVDSAHAIGSFSLVMENQHDGVPSGHVCSCA